MDSDSNKSIQNSEQIAENVAENIVLMSLMMKPATSLKFFDRVGDRITHIRVLCCCGHSIVIDCRYPDISEDTASEQPTHPCNLFKNFQLK